MTLNDDLSWMREVQEAAMLDTCYLQALSETQDTMGQHVKSWADRGNALACGLEMRPGSETRNADMTITKYDAVIRLPITAVPAIGERIRVTKRFGETLDTALLFQVNSPIQRGPSGIRVTLEIVET